MKNSSLFLALIFLLPSFGYGDELCSEVDYRNSLPAVRAQGSTGWCYAFTVADLLSFETGQSISALGIGVEYQNRENDLRRNDPFKSTGQQIKEFFEQLFTPKPNTYDFKQGGYLDDTLKLVMNKGLCIEEDFPQRVFELAVGDNVTHLGAMDFNVTDIRTNEQTRKAYEEIKKTIMEEEPENREILAPTSRSCNDFDGYIQTLFPHGNLAEFRERLRKLPRGVEPLNELYQTACRRRVYVDQRLSFKLEFRKKDGGESLLKFIDLQLKRSPVAVSYASEFLKDINSKPTANNHASSIIGRRQGANGCEYLVRNSWGPDCEKYDKAYECNNGHVWLPREIVRKMTTSVLGIR